MGAHPARRHIVPPCAPWHVVAALRMQRIVDAAVASGCFPAYQQQNLARAVVDEAMRDAGARRERREISRRHRVQSAIDPGIDFSLQNVDELLFFLLGVGPRASLARWEAHQIYANFEQTGGAPDAPLISVEFVAVRILMTILGHVTAGDNERRSSSLAHGISSGIIISLEVLSD